MVSFDLPMEVVVGYLFYRWGSQGSVKEDDVSKPQRQ